MSEPKKSTKVMQWVLTGLLGLVILTGLAAGFVTTDSETYGSEVPTTTSGSSW